MKKAKGFIKHGRFDTLEHAKNGTKDEKIAKARLDLYNLTKKSQKDLK